MTYKVMRAALAMLAALAAQSAVAWADFSGPGVVATSGAWTPTIQGQSTGGTYSTSVTGSWNRLGNVVIAQGQLSITAVTTAGSGNTIIGNLPFVASAVQHGICDFSNVSGATHQTGYTQWSDLVFAGTNGIFLTEIGSGNGYTFVPITNLSATASFIFTCTYTVAP